MGLLPASALSERDLLTVAPVVLAAEQLLPVPPVFHSILPSNGLQRGWTTRAIGGSSARALAWALLGSVTASGGWIAAVDVPGISLVAAREVGVAIERVLVVNSVDAATWASTIGALIGAVDAIVYGAPRHRVQPREYRRIASRCRERGTVLVELGSSGRVSGRPEGQMQYDVSFSVEPLRWDGLGAGYGRLHSRTLHVVASGRRVPGADRHGRFELPSVDGRLRQVALDAKVEDRPRLAAV